MKIDKSDQGRVYVADIGSEEITDAVNAVQRGYDAYMANAWASLDASDSEKSQAAVRGVAWTVALAAHHAILMRAAPDEIREVVKAMVEETVASMVYQVEMAKRRREEAQ